MILATKKHQLSLESKDLKFFLDADLVILGAAADRYDRYAADVRKEYAHVPEADYRAGRSAVLKKFLERPRLYFTEAMRERFEAAARENLQREIMLLSRQ
jgi:predicted metal-dependent HD superfamily phosphohydrolase